MAANRTLVDAFVRDGRAGDVAAQAFDGAPVTGYDTPVCGRATTLRRKVQSETPVARNRGFPLPPPQPPGPCRAVSGSQVASSGESTRITTITTMMRNIGRAVLAM